MAQSIVICITPISNFNKKKSKKVLQFLEQLRFVSTFNQYRKHVFVNSRLVNYNLRLSQNRSEFVKKTACLVRE